MNNTPQETITQEVIEDAKKAGLLSQVDEYGTYWFNNINGKSLRKFAQLTRERQASERCAGLKYDKNKIRAEVMAKKTIPFGVCDAIDLTMTAMEKLFTSPQQAIPSGYEQVMQWATDKEARHLIAAIKVDMCPKEIGLVKRALQEIYSQSEPLYRKLSAAPTAPIERDK
jgi:hypothetical protein